MYQEEIVSFTRINIMVNSFIFNMIFVEFIRSQTFFNVEEIFLMPYYYSLQTNKFTNIWYVNLKMTSNK